MKRINKLSLCSALVLMAFVACLTANVAFADETKEITKETTISIDDLKPSQLSMASSGGVYYTSYRDGLSDNQKILYDNFKSFFLGSNGLAKEYTTNKLSIVPANVGITYSTTYEDDYNTAANTLWDDIKPDFSYAFFSFIYDYPQAFWTNKLSINASFGISTSAHTVRVKACNFTFTLISDNYANLVDTYNTNIVAAASKIRSQSATTYDKVKGINDYLVETCTYNSSAASIGGDAYKYAHSSGEVFASSTHSVVCDGYAKAYKALANLLDVDCAIIVGYGNGGTHAWNDVKLGDYWYPVDSTWNDSTNSEKFLLQATSSFYSMHTEVPSQISTNGNIIFTFPTLNTKSYKEQCQATGHKYVLSSNGTYICDYCDETKTSTHVHSPASAVIENEVKATCTTDGSHESVVYCSSCGEEISREKVTTPKLGHSYKLTYGEVSATCTKDGRTAISTCSVCGDIIGGKTIPATGHTAGTPVVENKIEATCTTDGSYDSVVYCTVCGEEISRETIIIKKLGHTSGTAVKENEVKASCTTGGSYDSVVYCSVCGEEISRTTVKVAKLGHNYKVTSSAKSATCTEDGHTEEKTCTLCGNKIGGETIKANGHKAATAVKENEVKATCTKAGSYDSVVYCSVCKKEISRKTVSVAKISHTYKSTVVAPTYKAKGYTLRKCSVCGYSYNTNYTNMLALSAPTVTVSNKSTGIQITWNKVTGATKYVLYRGSTGIKTFSSTATLSYLDTSVKSKNGSKYTYKVVAVVADSSKQYQTSSTTKTIYRLTSPTVSKVTNSATKSLSVYWNKNSSATGYQIQYSLNSSFSSSTKLYITKNSTVSKQITGLTKGKYYYVRVRSYKTVNGVKYYSEWTTYKTRVKVSK